MFYRLLRFLAFASYALAIYVPIATLNGRLNGLSAGDAYVISAALLLGVTAAFLKDHLRNFATPLCRLLITLPTASALTLLLPVLLWESCPFLKALSIAGFSAGAYFIYRYVQESKKYFNLDGHGPMPEDALLDVPLAMWQPGDIAVAGNVGGWRNTANTLYLGHAEDVILDKDGKLKVHTSFMFKGVLMRDPQEFIDDCKAQNCRYVILRPRQPLTQAQIDAGTEHAHLMFEQNKKFREKMNHRIDRLIQFFHPKASDEKLSMLKEKEHWSGYNWPGMLISGICLLLPEWTCVEAAVVNEKAMGVKLDPYGVGVAGLLGFFNPILPGRLLGDSHLRYLTKEDGKKFEAAKV